MQIFDSTAHQAVTRLFDMSRSGETDSCEFDQLDSMIYEQLVRNYETMPDQAPARQAPAA